MGFLPLENGPQDHLFRGKLEQLFRLVSTHDGKTQVDFAMLMNTNRSNVARWILQLERMQLISRTVIPGSARTYGIHLTGQGRTLALSRRFLAQEAFNLPAQEEPPQTGGAGTERIRALSAATKPGSDRQKPARRRQQVRDRRT